MLPNASSGKDPQVPNTARQVACLPGNTSRGKRSSMPQPKTRPDSPVPSLQGPRSSGKDPQVPNTARQVACLPGNTSRGKRSSMPQPKTRPDSPVPSLQGPCDRSLKSEEP